MTGSQGNQLVPQPQVPWGICKFQLSGLFGSLKEGHMFHLLHNFQDNCYAFFDIMSTWVDAEKYCVDKGSHLASFQVWFLIFILFLRFPEKNKWKLEQEGFDMDMDYL